MKHSRVTRCALVALILAILPSVRAQSNAVFREVFRDIGGGVTVADLTGSAKFIANTPDEITVLTSLFEAPTDVLDNYGQRLRALITAPVTGQYTFWIASDDASDLYLSPDTNPANKIRIAYVALFTASREWTKEANQQSAPLFLNGGQRYYIEALMKEGTGGDNLAVRWLRPGGVDEAPINLTNCVPYGKPLITTQPGHVAVTVGGTAAFSVSAIGSTPLSYQWRKNGTPIPGAVNSTLTFSNVFLSDSGGYSCSVGNSLGSLNSQVASLTVLSDVTQPGDPIFPSSGNTPPESVANAIDNQPTKYLNFDAVNTGFTVTPSSGSSVVQALALTSANDAPDRDPASFTLEGSNNGSNYVVIASNGVPVFSARFERVVISFANNTPFLIYRLIFPITAGPSVCCMQIAEVEFLAAIGPPTITSSPLSRTVTNGNNTTFSVTAIGSPPLSYQWYFNGANLSGRTNASFTIVGAGPANAGNYTVVVANSAGSVTSTVATLTVLVPSFIQTRAPDANATGVSPRPAINVVINPGNSPITPASVRLSLDGTLVPATVGSAGGNTTVDYTGTNILGALSVHTLRLVYDDTAGSNTNTWSFTVANYQNVTLPSPIYLETFDGLAEAALPAGWSATNNTARQTTGFDLNNPISDAYLDFVVISSNRFATVFDNRRLLLPFIVLNGAVLDRLIHGNSVYADSDQRQNAGGQVNVLFTEDYDLTGHSNVFLAFNSTYEQNQDNIGSVEYSIDMGVTWLPVIYYLDDQGGAADIIRTNGVIDVQATFGTPRGDQAYTLAYSNYIGAPVSTDLIPSIAGRINDDSIDGKRIEVVRLASADGQSKVRFRIGQAGTSSWYFGIDDFGLYSINSTNTPVISTQPASLMVTQGQSANFSVVALGDPPLSYQWRFNGNNLAGQTSASLTIFSAAQANEGGYSVVVANSAGSITSAVATLTVLVPPSDRDQLPNSLNIGQNKVGTVIYDGNGSYTIVGGGNDIWDQRDEFTYAYTEVTGNFDVQVRVESLTANAQFAKAGLMARESLSEYSRMAFARVTPDQAPGVNNRLFAYRTGLDNVAGVNGGQHEDGGPVTSGLPNGWLRLVRIGNTVSMSNSVDGTTWNLSASQDTTTWGGGALSSKLFVGLGVSRYSGASLITTAVFRQFQFNPNAAPFAVVGAESRGNPNGVRVLFNNPVGAGAFVPGNYVLTTMLELNVTRVTGVRFTTANDAPERDPLTYTLEGTTDDPAVGSWELIASGATGLAADPGRNTVGPTVNFANANSYRSYRVLFPTVRDVSANSMQIAEIELLDAGGVNVTEPTDSVVGVRAIAGSSMSEVAVAGTAAGVNNYPAAEHPALAFDESAGTKYLNFAKINTGVIITSSGGVQPGTPVGVIAVVAGPNANTVQLTTSQLVVRASYVLQVANVLAANGTSLTSGNAIFTHGEGYEPERIRVTHNKTDDSGYYAISDATAKSIGDITALGGGVFPPSEANTVFEDPIPDTGTNEQFSTSIYGVLSPTATGNHIFYMSSDDVGRLYLSTDANPANKVQIASEPAWNGSREYIAGGNQATRGTPPANVSAPISLQAGGKYYMELSFTEGGGGNNGSATWLPPGGTAVVNGSSPIPEQFFAPSRLRNGNSYNTLGPVRVISQPATQTVLALLPVTFTVGLDGTPDYTYQWRRNGGAIPGANSRSYTIPAAQISDDQALYSVAVANEFSSATSANALLTVLVPPTISAPTNLFTVIEGTLLTFTNTASDANSGQVLTFALAAGAPAGTAVNATNGVFTWTPTEAQGPSSNNVSIIVSDNGTPALSATQVVAIVVLEANSAPVLTAIGDRNATEGVPLAFTATASDPDVPANGRTFTLGSGAPAGASITAGGNFTWTPSEAQGPGVYGVTFIVSDNGVPVLSDAETIQITVSEVNTAPLVSVPTNSVAVTEGNLLSFSASGSDNDLPAQTLTFSLAAGAPVGAAITAGGAFTWTPTEAQGPSSNNVSIIVSDNGTPALSATQVVAIVVFEANSAPVLTAIGDRSATEGVPLAFTATASDPDVPANGRTFTLGSGAPAGTSITAGGNFTWTPSEAQGPGVYGVTFIVSDNGVPVLSDAETIQITVSEVNTAPLVSVPTNSVAVTEGNLLSFSASGSDNDLPAQTLTFSLAAGAPAGAAITAGGAFTWTPTEAQGPSSNNVSIIVSDNGTPALSATQAVAIVVLEANSAPVLTAIGDRNATEGVPLAFTATASDPDVPANGRTFTLGSGAPAGASITAGGNFTWTPSEAQGPGVYGVTFIVSDNGVPVLSDAETIQITVSEVNTAPLVSVPTNSVAVTEGNLLSFSASGSDNDLPAQTLTFSLAAGAPAGAAITAGGAFTWTPTEAQGPSSNNVSIIVSDNGTPALSATQAVAIVVLEANSAPVLTAIGNKSVLQGQTLSFTLSATDADVPANVLTYSMSGAPGGATLNTDTGAFSWVAINAGTFNVTFGVQDNGVPIRTDSEAIQIVVMTTNTAPTISVQPASQTVTNGSDAVFSVSATGTDPLAYQWRLNGNILAGQTSASLTIFRATPANAGKYTVVIANSAGSATSVVAMLTVVTQLAVLESYALDLPAGYSLIANQLYQGNNLISAVLPNVPNGTMLFKWNGAIQSFLVESYVAGLGWQPGTTTLAPGEGAFINLPSPQTLVFAGESRPPTLPLNLFAGYNLVSRQIPRPGTFQEITGRSPGEGAVVDQYRPATDDYRTHVFVGGEWRDHVPTAQVGEAVWISQIALPIITGQPVPQINAIPGSTVNFAVEVSGTPPLRFQWQRNGVSIPDATNAFYTINNVQILDLGIYTVAVQPSRIAPPTAQPGRPEDLPGTVGSAPAALRFVTTDFPFSNNFGARPVVNTFAATLTGNNSAATLEPSEPLHAGKPGGHSVWLAWMAPANGVVTFFTLGSSFDTLLAAYSGNGFPLAEVESDDDGGPFLSSQITFNATAGQIYNIAVDGFGNGSGNFVLSWILETTTDRMPSILRQPQNQLVSFNGSAQFSVGAAGANLTYQWFRNGQAVSGATLSNFVISPVRDSDVGVYFVQINSGSRFAFSHPVLLQISSAGENGLFGQDKFQDIVVATTNSALVALPGKAVRKTVAHGFSGTEIMSSIGSVKQAGEPNHCGMRGGKSQWFSYQPTNSGTLKVDTDGSNFDTVLAIYVGPGDDFLTLTNVACDNNSGTNGRTSAVLFNVTSNTIYYIAVDGVNHPITGVAASGSIHFNYRLVLPLTLTSLGYSSSNANGRIVFKVNGTPNVATTVQSASSLAAPTWTSIFTNTTANGSFNYTNTNALTFSNRFYRAIHQF